MSVTIADEEIEYTAALSLFQKQVLYSILINQSKSSYLEQARYTLQGCEELTGIIRAWELTIQSFDNLRTVFCWEHVTEPIQIVLKHKELSYEYYDFTSLAEYETESRINELFDKKWQQGVDLSMNPFQLVFCRLTSDSWCIIICIHHLLIDGWSNWLMIKQFMGYLNGDDNATIQHAPSYAEYIDWSVNRDRKHALRFWNMYLDGISYHQPFTVQQKSAGNQVHFTLSLDKYIPGVEEYIRQNEVTLAAFLFGVWGLMRIALFHDETHQFDLLTAITVSGRNDEYPDIDKVSGMLIKTVPLRIRGIKSIRISAYFKNIMNDIIRVLEYSYMDMTELLYHQILKHEINDVMVIQNYPAHVQSQSAAQNPAGAKIAFVSSRYESNAAVTVGFKAFQKGITLDFCYDQSRIPAAEMAKICLQLRKVIQQITTEPDISINNILES